MWDVSNFIDIWRIDPFQVLKLCRCWCWYLALVKDRRSNCTTSTQVETNTHIYCAIQLTIHIQPQLNRLCGNFSRSPISPNAVGGPPCLVLVIQRYVHVDANWFPSKTNGYECSYMSEFLLNYICNGDPSGIASLTYWNNILYTTRSNCVHTIQHALSI